MDKPIIEVNNLGKKYDIAHMRGGYVALRDVIAEIARQPFSFLTHKAKRTFGLEKKEAFWALRDVNFTVKRGEIVGVIGANGAGKSTLLKILSQITPPTEGEVILRGRVGSLLEVGTGFHPELTGRENIFLNGAILGMKKREIAKKFDEIVAFAGVDKFLDTPVKFYSSGMYVRLAFSVAAHMEPDILLVDEVLAVGDAEFQKKCLGKMDEITRTEGRTILFVSHNMAAIQDICPKSILLENGKIAAFGATENVIRQYQETSLSNSDLGHLKRRGDGRVRVERFSIEDRDGKKIVNIHDREAILVFGYSCGKPDATGKVDVGFSLYKYRQLLGTRYSSYEKRYFNKLGTTGEFRFALKNIPLSSGGYEIGVRVLVDGIEVDCPKEPIGSFNVERSDQYPDHDMSVENRSTIIPEGEWLTQAS